MSIRREDITTFDHGIEIHIRRTKTQQEKGHTVFIPCAKSSRCPVKALEKWLALSGIEQGPVFRAINRHDQIIGERGITAQSVALVLKAATSHAMGAEAAKSVAGHSLRAGLLHRGCQRRRCHSRHHGADGHRSSATLAKYIRPLSRRKTPSLL